MNAIPVDGLRSVCVVVNDARSAAERYATVHGIRTWEVRRYDGQRLSETVTRGFRADQEFIEATGVAQTAAGPVTFALVQPLGGWTTYHEFLNTRGEGIHSICTAAVTPDELAALRAWLHERGVAVAQSARRDGAVEHVLFDTRENSAATSSRSSRLPRATRPCAARSTRCGPSPLPASR